MNKQQELRSIIRKNYKMYINDFKDNNTLNSIIDEPRKALELAFVKECHYFFMRDMEYNYDLIKALYEKAFFNNFNETNHGFTFYNYLVIFFIKKDSFDFQDWESLIEWFNNILIE